VKDLMFWALLGGSVGLLVRGWGGVSPMYWPVDAWVVFAVGTGLLAVFFIATSGDSE